MSAVLKPGRYVVLGGPGGHTAVRRVMRDTGNGHAIDRGCVVIRTAAYTDKWQPLGTFRVRPGHRATHYGTLGAVMRMWSLT